MYFDPATRDQMAAQVKRKSVPQEQAIDQAPPMVFDARSESLFSAIEERRKTEPLIGARLGGKEILKRVMETMHDDKKVHIESLLTLLGALAGFACQMRARAQIHMKPPPNGVEIVRVDCNDGATYFMGDAINRPLAEGQYSVWSLICGAAENNGATPQDRPDLHELFTYVTSTLGTPAFGQPRLPGGFPASDTPFNYLKHFWSALQPIVERYCASPAEWPILYAGAIQDVIDQASATTPGYIAVAIVMESAIPMSKIDPALIGVTIPQTA